MLAYGRKIGLEKIGMRVVLLASLVLAAFAHTAPSQNIALPDGIDARAYAAKYTLPDGTLPIVCDRTGKGGTQHPGATPCEFCSLAKSTDLAAPAEVASTPAFDVTLDNCLAPQTMALVQSKLGFHGASRAPPHA